MNGLTERIARFIHEAGAAQFPVDAVDKAKRVIADTFAVILAGGRSEVGEPLMRYLALESAHGTSPILGTSRRASAEMAALVNGSFGHALDFDDVLSLMPAHPSAIIVAALIADLGTCPLDGATFIEAYVVGIEVGARIAQGISVGHYDRGFHGTGTLGIFSAVGALAKARRLDIATTRQAFGIAASMASGLRRNFGTMTKPLHTGLAARNALAAVRLASCGFTAAPDVLEAKSGFYAAYGVPESDQAVAIAELDKPGWIIVDPGIALKKFACCYASHRGMDGTLRMRDALGVGASDVARLVCRMPPGGMLVLTYPVPVTGLEGKFSLQYSLAAGLLDGHYSLATFTDDAVRRPEIRALLPRVDAYEDEACRGDDPLFETRSSGSRGFVVVEFELRDGRRQSLRIDKAPGHPSRELSWDDIEAKFKDCASAASLPEAVSAAAFETLRNFERAASVDTFVATLCRSSATDHAR